MATKTVVYKKKAKEPKKKFPKKVVGNPSKFIGCGIFKYYDDFIHVDLVRGVKIERKEGESNEDLEKRAVKRCYLELQDMHEEFKTDAFERGFKVK